MTLDVQISKKYPLFISNGVASCATADPEVFFPLKGSNGTNVKTAKRICKSCPYVTSCLEWAITNKESGIWGGTTESERKRMLRNRKKIKAEQKVSA